MDAYTEHRGGHKIEHTKQGASFAVSEVHGCLIFNVVTSDTPTGWACHVTCGAEFLGTRPTLGEALTLAKQYRSVRQQLEGAPIAEVVPELPASSVRADLVEDDDIDVE